MHRPEVLEKIGKVCLITGASSGIGKSTALGLARMGATVVMVGRDRERIKKARVEVVRETGNDRVETALCDLSRQAEVRRLAAEFKAGHDRLDVLVNNAAVVPTARTLTADGIEMQFAVNHLAYFLLTSLLLDALEAAAPSRIVNVSSGMHGRAALDDENLQGEKSYKPMAQYALTKLLNIYFTYELARRLEGTGITVNCLSPGFIATSLARDFSPFSRFVFEKFGKKAEKGAGIVVHLASSPEVANLTGRYFQGSREVKSSSRSYDRELARRVWETSERMTKTMWGLPPAGLRSRQ
jgi:NAD(P)-dependent dehydrogenase (short-subunit alcohol dehydrogenase family)